MIFHATFSLFLRLTYSNEFNMKIKTLVLLCALLVCVASACKKDETSEKWAKEEADLADWMKENHPDLTSDKGVYIEKFGPAYPDNIQPEANDYVLVNFICSFLYDDVIETVSYKDWQGHGAKFHSFYREGGPELWPYERWVNMGIDQLYENERANIYVPSRILNLQDFKPRKYEIELVKVIDTDIKSYQEKLMGHCMKKYGKNVDTITIKDKGKDYYVIFHVDEGKGDPVDISSVKTHHNELYLLQEGDYRTCFSNQVKTGWDKKFSKMFQSVKSGGKITVVMPYRIMYGEEPYMDANKQNIAPSDSVLKYEISIDQ